MGIFVVIIQYTYLLMVQKSGVTHQLRLVVYPIISKGLYIYIYPRISEPSTVSVDLTPQPPGCVHGGIHEGLGWDPFLRCP